MYSNTYKTEELIKNATVSLKTKKKAVIENTWNRSQLITFLNHPKMLNTTFPCTSRNGIDPGKPCVFTNSSKYMSNFNSCKKWFAKVCYTNIIDNSSVEEEPLWGYCREDCNDVNPEPGSKYNLARNEELFSANIFNFQTFESGMCHTYDPPQDSVPDFDHR